MERLILTCFDEDVCIHVTCKKSVHVFGTSAEQSSLDRPDAGPGTVSRVRVLVDGGGT